MQIWLDPLGLGGQLVGTPCLELACTRHSAAYLIGTQQDAAAWLCHNDVAVPAATGKGGSGLCRHLMSLCHYLAVLSEPLPTNTGTYAPLKRDPLGPPPHHEQLHVQAHHH